MVRGTLYGIMKWKIIENKNVVRLVDNLEENCC